MHEAVRTYKVNEDERYYVIPDDEPVNPRTDYDNMSKFICFHKRYTLGDKHDYKSDDYANWDEIRAKLIEDYDPISIRQVSMIDHSGLSVWIGDPNCPWDSGVIGFIFIPKAVAFKEFGVTEVTPELVAKIDALLEYDIENYDDYLTGNCYGFRHVKIVTCDQGHEHEQEINSCWGFLGDIDDCGILDELPEGATKIS